MRFCQPKKSAAMAKYILPNRSSFTESQYFIDSCWCPTTAEKPSLNPLPNQYLLKKSASQPNSPRSFPGIDR